ncbi:hypothetical protein JTE90_007536 [Oedothorax gibbosus]|uniref:Uncharacterized protein n=1 Tax=Oedothorax gibbosus TaxID=931172 RepID=A0AAV6VLB7_9ARAC|nr:hypothetical protein JTE90_007536 [Oedothorax gibbosus]
MIACRFVITTKVRRKLVCEAGLLVPTMSNWIIDWKMLWMSLLQRTGRSIRDLGIGKGEERGGLLNDHFEKFRLAVGLFLVLYKLQNMASSIYYVRCVAHKCVVECKVYLEFESL